MQPSVPMVASPAVYMYHFKMADDGQKCGFRINTEYAKKYNTWREKEELQKLKDRFGNADEDDSSTSESEDEDAEGLTSKVEKDWLRTYAAVKTKNPKIYDKSVNFFSSDGDENDDEPEKVKKVKANPMYLKDYERKVILEKGGVVSESEDEDEDDQKHPPGYYEEQEEIKNSLVRVVQEDDGVSDDEDLLVKRPKTIEEKEREDEDYLEWLKGQKPDLDEDVKTDLAPLKEMWSDPKLDEGDKFLRDYILNKRYLEDGDEEYRIPTYDEITHEENLSDDELLVEKQESFERRFNFRFEEEDSEFIKSYPRTLGESVRRKDDRRTKKRAEVKERKEREKAKKREELKQLKNLKRREILAKLEQLKQITGNATLGISETDIEGDFDPKHYDSLMQKVFNEDYYDGDDDEKPTFEDDEEFEIDLDQNWDDWTGPQQQQQGPSTAGPSQEGQEDYEPGCEDPDFNMDADYDPHADRNFGLDGRTKKAKKKSKFKMALEKKKPQFDPSQKSFEEYLDEFYKLDYEDMIGDVPCRFKYRQVAPNDYGLTVDEVLKCDDKELNAWVSLKKMSQYRTEEDEHYERRFYSKKARNIQKKLNVLHSLAESEEDEKMDEPEERKESKTMKKRRRKKRQREEALAREMANPSSLQNRPLGAPPKKDIKGGKRSGMVTDSSGDGGPKKKMAKLMVIEMAASNEESMNGSSNRGEPGNVSRSEVKSKEHGSNDSAKAKKKAAKKPKRQGPGVMSDERLKAFGINPKKFKYTHLPKIKEKRKRDKQNQKHSVS